MLIFCVTISVLVVAVCTIVITAQIQKNNYERNVFSTERWNENVMQRTYMIDDLLSRYEIIGMSRDEILDLLGTNALTRIFPDVLMYRVGRDFLHIIQFMIHFDENDIAYQYSIMYD